MLTLIRHGGSENTEENRMSGWLNDNLTQCGVSLACEAAATLALYHFDKIYSSDLERAKKTAEIIRGFNHHSAQTPEIELAEELRERSGGIYEGMRYEDIRKISSPKKYKIWLREYFEAPPMGESMQDVSERVVPFLKEYVYPSMAENKNVLISSHETVIQIIIGDLKKMNEADIPGMRIEYAIPYFFYGLPSSD